MQIFKEIAPLRAFLRQIRSQNKSIGFVPTMGALHQGHMALIESSKAKSDFTVCSIFVNPAQFNQAEDLKNYPKSLDADIQILSQKGCDLLFCPDETEIYKAGSITGFHFSGLDQTFEGKFRPGHFNGVALIVAKLFNIVNPDNVFFGQKDLQQYFIISKLIADLNYNIKLHMVPTVREDSGLALSSRNRRLDSVQLSRAQGLSKCLIEAKTLLKKGMSFSDTIDNTKTICTSLGLKLEYFELIDFSNFSPALSVELAKEPVICISAFVDDIRLIDNMFLNDK